MPPHLLTKLFLLFVDSLNGPFPAAPHRFHHKPKRYPPIQPCGNLSSFPLQFHPSTKGSQIIMDLSQRTVKRQASFCNAITFSNRPIAVYEQVRLKVNVFLIIVHVFCVPVRRGYDIFTMSCSFYTNYSENWSFRLWFKKQILLISNSFNKYELVILCLFFISSLCSPVLIFSVFSLCCSCVGQSSGSLKQVSTSPIRPSMSQTRESRASTAIWGTPLSWAVHSK